MENKLYKNQKNSICKIATTAGLSRQNLYNYSNKIQKITNMPMDMIVKIAKVEGISPYELYNQMYEYLGNK